MESPRRLRRFRGANLAPASSMQMADNILIAEGAIEVAIKLASEQ